MPGTCASPIISNNKQIRSQKTQCLKVKCLVRSMESFSYFVYIFFLFHNPDSNTGCVMLNSWMIENLPEGNEQNQEDHSNSCVSDEMLTGYLRNKGQGEQRCSVGVARNLIRVHIPCFVIVMFLAVKCASLGFRVALGYDLDDATFEYRKGQEIFLFSQIFRPA